MSSGGSQELHCATAEQLWLQLAPTQRLFPDPSKPIFRGQSNAAWQLVPSVLREPERRRAAHAGDGRHTLDFQVFYEAMLLETFGEFCDQVGVRIPGDSILFRKRALSVDNQDAFFLSPGKWPNPELLEVMALAQHHGVPTRLLDWTTNPYAAAYFAAASALRKFESWTPDDRLAVWALDIETINRHDERVQIVKPPGSTTPHLAAQCGLFTVQTLDGRRGDTFEVTALDEALSSIPPSPLLKLTLPVMESLKLYTLCRKVGISAATMFPGTDGAAKAVADDVNAWGAARWLANHPPPS